MQGLVAHVEITIHAPLATVWDALTNPEKIKQYMFGTIVTTDWQKGSPIVWQGEWQGKAYEDKGQIIQIEKEKLLEVTHFSPLSGTPDLPENYHTVRYELSSQDNYTTVTLTQDNNTTEEEKAHTEKNWHMFLEGLKKVVEQ